MKVVKLKENEVRTLKVLDNNILSSYLDNAHHDAKSAALLLVLTAEDLEKISDLLCDILTDKGITDGEINNFGQQIDELIGKFNPYG